MEPRALAYDKPLCVSIDGFTLHAATRAGPMDATGREALVRYVLRPPIGQDRVELLPDGTDLLGVGEPAAAPVGSPRRGPPYWRSLVLRRMTLGDHEA